MCMNTCVGAKNGSLGQNAFVGTYIREWSIDKGLIFNNNFRFQSIYLQFGIDVANPFSEMPYENQTLTCSGHLQSLHD